jgi:DNA-binding response OmpR family regulator
MAKVLSQNNFEILTAADGDMGLIQFAQNKEAIRLVITDMMMPGLEGGTFVKSIHIMKPGTKVIATSGLAEHHNLPGAISFLRKPFSAAELLKIVHATLNVQETPPG